MNRGWWVAVLAAITITAIAEARTAVVKARARLRTEPNAQSQLVTWLEPGTKLEVVAEKEGWAEVAEPGGRRGYVWGEHLEGGAAGDAKKPAESAGGSVADDLKSLRADVTALRERVEKGSASEEMERLRGEVERLAAAQRDLARRLDERRVPIAPADPPAAQNGSGGGSLLVVIVIAALLGWGVSRFARRGRDRQRNRLRF